MDEQNHSSSRGVFFLIITLCIIIAGFGFWWYRAQAPHTPPDETIPEDDSEIPDTTGWQTIHDESAGVTYRFPTELPTTYIHAQEWPPAITRSGDVYTCPIRVTGLGLQTEQTQAIINGKQYCVTAHIEGAAGSFYTTNTYTTTKNSELVTLRFGLRASQCANYDEPQREACETERVAFSVDNMIDTIIQTMVFDRESS
jgi:hypothetical protein